MIAPGQHEQFSDEFVDCSIIALVFLLVLELFLLMLLLFFFVFFFFLLSCSNFVGCRLMPPTPHGFLGRRRACHGGLSWAGLGASEGPKSTPEGAKRAPRRAPGASWAPGRPQVATKAALRPPLGGSWGALGALLGSS